MKAVSQGEIIWEPSAERTDKTVLSQYVKWLEVKKGVKFLEYKELWEWSVHELEEFWASVAEFCDVKFNTPYTRVLENMTMPGAKWFQGASLNYAENIFANYQHDKTAIYFRSEHLPQKEISWKELEIKCHQLPTH